MIVSDPPGQDPQREVLPVDMIIRELEKLYYAGRITHAVYHRAADLARVQERILVNIYRGSATGLQQVLALLLRQTAR